MESEQNTLDTSPKLRLIALITALIGFCGIAGIHRFYAGKIGTGILMFITAGFFGIWTLIDVVVIAAGDFKDKDGKRIITWNN